MGMTTYLTVKEVAQALKVSPAKVRAWIRSGRLAAIRVGRSHRVSEDALAAMETKPKPFAPTVPLHYAA